MLTNPKSTTVASVYIAGAGLAIVLGVIWLLGNTEEAYACKCVVPGSPSEELEKFDVVFAGRVLSVRHSFDPNALSYSPGDITTVGFSVSTVWKGTVEENVTLTTPPTGGSCGFAFAEGEEYVVYAYKTAEDAPALSVSICSRTALLQEAQDDIDALGEGYLPQGGTAGASPGQPQDSGTSMTRTIILAIVAAAAVLAAAAMYARRRSQRGDSSASR